MPILSEFRPKWIFERFGVLAGDAVEVDVFDTGEQEAEDLGGGFKATPDLAGHVLCAGAVSMFLGRVAGPQLWRLLKSCRSMDAFPPVGFWRAFHVSIAPTTIIALIKVDLPTPVSPMKEAKEGG